MKGVEEENDTIQQAVPQILSTSQLSSAVNMIEKWLQQIEGNDHSAEHSRFVLTDIGSCLEPEKELLYEGKKGNVKTEKYWVSFL